MDYIEKQNCLFVFKTLLNFYNTNLVITNPVYDDTQPSKSFEKTIFNHIFHDSALGLLPHTIAGTVYDFKSAKKLVLSTFIGRQWPTSTYTFANESDYIDVMQSVNFTVEPSPLYQKNLLNDYIANYVGYGVVSRNIDNVYVICTRHLKQFEIREGYSNLDCVVYLDDTMEFDYCEIGGNKRTDELAIRECITAITTMVQIEEHLGKVHFATSDKFNVLLHTLDKKNPVHRLLLPITHKPYSANESGAISLLGQTGLCTWFNFTRKGVGQCFEYAINKFNIRDTLIPKKNIPGESPIHKHQHMWFDCIRNFVSEFLSIQTSLDCDDFIILLKENYNGIYDETTSKLENMIDICTMVIYSNIIHECCSNPGITKFTMNPFAISTSWKQNDSLYMIDKINNLGQQTLANFLSWITSSDAIRLNDERWIDMCCVNDVEKKIYNRFMSAMLTLDIPVDAVLHSNNISSSIAY